MKPEIKPQEIRLGNYLQWKESDNYVTVTGISEDAEGWILDYADHETSLENGLWLDHFTCIPLTTEWLEKFGFEKYESDEKHFVIRHHKIKIGDYDIDVKIEMWKGDGKWDDSYSVYYGFDHITTSKYIHHLQNLIQSLTGQELEMKGE